MINLKCRLQRHFLQVPTLFYRLEVLFLDVCNGANLLLHASFHHSLFVDYLLSLGEELFGKWVFDGSCGAFDILGLPMTHTIIMTLF